MLRSLSSGARESSHRAGRTDTQSIPALVCSMTGNGYTPIGLVPVQVSWINDMRIGPPPYEQPRVYEQAIGPAPVYVRPPAYVQPQVSEP